ncbi:hypothetical protein OIU74_017732 [Salix koriyanagi]|uniref:t-SNARE coiled-coil homology domain-containing protein n=2 Tax=Salix TaxID=40685 RepID=A0A9Q0WQF8_9ROSI|nr:hypothetical protein OIU74_017732 [Salix koriyanagi]
MVEKRETYMKPRVPSGKGEVDLLFRTEDIVFPCGTSPGRLFLDCLSFSSSASKFDDDDSCVVIDEDQRSQISRCYSVGNGSLKTEHPSPSGFSDRGVSFSGDPRQARLGGMNDARFGPKSKLMAYAPPSTIGGSALALHYANVIIVIEKLLRYPHLVGEEARDDLYQMLPTSLRVSLRTHLKSYAKNLAIYDAPLAHDWKETLDGILRWLAPLAHNFIRWQSERNFEQHQIVNRTNVLLLQTLYFADRGKTEAAICELLVGMNYICRYEHQQNALLDCASSFDYEDCMQWQLQCRASFGKATWPVCQPNSGGTKAATTTINTSIGARELKSVEDGGGNQRVVWYHGESDTSHLHDAEQQQQPQPQQTMSYRREHRNSRTALFDDGLEEGGLRSSSSFSHETDDHDNDKAVHTLQDRVLFLKSLTGDIHEEVESQNRLLDRMGNNMDTSRGIMSGTMDRFKMVFEKKSSRRTCALAGFFILSFFILYYLIRVLVYLKQG